MKARTLLGAMALVALFLLLWELLLQKLLQP
jgi:hypothetical protein